MKRSFLLRIPLLFAVGSSGNLQAEVLPTGLQLPPRPQALVAQVQTKGIPAGLPGGPAPVFVPGSRLILPEKPVLAQGTEDPPPSAPDAPELAPGAAPPGPDPAEPDPGALPGLLPLPPDQPESSSEGLLPLPDDAAPPAGAPGSPEPAPAVPGQDPGKVPGAEFKPGPRGSGESPNPQTRGPIFRIRGGEAFALARQRGFRFTPADGIGPRDGNHTVASQVPNVLTSEVHGTRMMQMRPSPLWTSPFIENTFYMFCDGSYNAVKLQPGWKIRGIQLQGPDWAWVACPRSGANTVSFSIRIRAWKRPDAPAQGTVVTLQGLTLEGPAGATDWKAAFPDLKRPAGMGAKK